MQNGAAQGPSPQSLRVGWKQMRRINAHRTSRPTDDAIRRMAGLIASERGKAPHVDAVILAAMRLATERAPVADWLEAVRAIEADTYVVRVLDGEPIEPHEPGE